MEYASEMIIKAKINQLKMCELPTILRKDLRNRKIIKQLPFRDL